MAASTVVDYQGRTVDVLAFQGANPEGQSGERQLRQALVEAGRPGGYVCTGIQKLAQRWLLEFLTVDGSMPFLPTRGCPFQGQASRGELRTSVDAEQAFFLSAQQVQLNLRAEEDDAMADDERLASATLESLAVSPDYLTLRVRVTSRAGAARVVITPVPVALRAT